MKQLTLILISLMLISTSEIFSQDKRVLKAAELSFSSAEKDYKKDKFLEAAEKFTIVVNSIPAATDSRKHLELRLDALINLVDIYFYKYVNITQACEFLGEYNSTMNTIKNTGVLKSVDLLKYLKKEQEYANKELKQCEGYERIGGDMDKFRNKTFDKVFDKEFK